MNFDKFESRVCRLSAYAIDGPHRDNSGTGPLCYNIAEEASNIAKSNEETFIHEDHL